MEYAIGLFFFVLWSGIRRCLVPFAIGTVVVTVIVGAICALSGGEFWSAVKYTLGACVALGAVAAIIATLTGMRRG